MSDYIRTFPLATKSMKQAREERERKSKYAHENYLRKKEATLVSKDVLPQSKEEKKY